MRQENRSGGDAGSVASGWDEVGAETRQESVVVVDKEIDMDDKGRESLKVKMVHSQIVHSMSTVFQWRESTGTTTDGAIIMPW